MRAQRAKKKIAALICHPQSSHAPLLAAVGAPCLFFFPSNFFLALFLFSFFFLQKIKPLDPLTFSVGNQILDREIHVLLRHCYKRQGHTALSLRDPGLRRRHHDIQNLSFVNKKRHTFHQHKLSLQRLHNCPMLASCMPLVHVVSSSSWSVTWLTVPCGNPDAAIILLSAETVILPPTGCARSNAVV